MDGFREINAYLITISPLRYRWNVFQHIFSNISAFEQRRSSKSHIPIDFTHKTDAFNVNQENRNLQFCLHLQRLWFLCIIYAILNILQIHYGVVPWSLTSLCLAFHRIDATVFKTGLKVRRFSQVLEMTEYSFRYGQKTEKSQISTRFGEAILWPRSREQLWY